MNGQLAGGRFWRMLLLSLIFVLPLAGCWTGNDDGMADVQAPIAEQKPKVMSIHDVERTDEFYWLRDDARKNPAVLALIAAENQHTQSVMAHTDKLQNQLFTEITARFTDRDKTVPIFQGDYAYHREFREGGEQPIYLRHKLAGATLDEDTTDEVMLDVNSLARGHGFYEVSNWSVSSDQNLLAFTEDTVGRRQYKLRFKDIDSGLFLADEISGVASSIAWAQDNKTVFYVRLDPQTLLPFQVYRHVLGTAVASDQLVYEESDRSFYTAVSTTRSNAFVVINLSSTDSTEIRLIDSRQPASPPVMFMARQADHEYRIRHVSGTFYILTNWQAPNFRLMKVDEAQLNNQQAWREVIGHRPDTLLQDTEVFNDYLVVNERRAGLPVLRVIRRDDETANGQLIGFPDPTYTARLHSNPEVDSVKLRYVYSSLTTPESVYEYDMATATNVLLKRDRVEGDFAPERYTSERIVIEARDNT
ncbi:MAG: oligopeptidase B, partial [Candidatus Azotimanducaceae bacterium]